MTYGKADYLLRFDSEEQAQQFGIANGFARTGKDGKVVTTLATHEYGLAVIGEYFPPPEDPEAPAPEPVGDGKWWVLFRDLKGLDFPAGAEAYVVWASWQTEEVPDPEDPTATISVPRPRPLDAPQANWA